MTNIFNSIVISNFASTVENSIISISHNYKQSGIFIIWYTVVPFILCMPLFYFAGLKYREVKRKKIKAGADKEELIKEEQHFSYIGGPMFTIRNFNIYQKYMKVKEDDDNHFSSIRNFSIRRITKVHKERPKSNSVSFKNQNMKL